MKLLQALMRSLLAFLLVVLIASPVWAQYTIPDCFVAALNSTFPRHDFDAARDQYLRQVSSDWDQMVAGLSGSQLRGYTAYFCANLRISDGGLTADGGRHVNLSYPTPSQYFATLGPASAPQPTATATPAISLVPQTSPSSTTVLFETDFASIPDQLVIGSVTGNHVNLVQDGGVNVLRIEARANQPLAISGGQAWDDYAVEVRIKMHSGQFVIWGRVAGSGCGGYQLILDPTAGTLTLQTMNSSCSASNLSSAQNVNVTAADWVTLRLEMDGSQLTGLLNGTSLVTATDTTYTSGVAGFLLMSGGKAETEIAVIRVESLGAPSVLTAYDATPGEAIGELQRLGLVPVGGQLLFQEDRAYFNGRGNFFTPLARRSPHTDIVMAGELTYNIGDSTGLQLCGLMARVTTSGNIATQELDVAFFDNGEAVLFDAINNSFNAFELSQNTFDLSVPHHILLTAFDSAASAYIDGQKVFDNIAVTRRSGSFGIGLTSSSANARCEGRNIWVYTFD
jgi:glycosyl hydrolase family 59 (putative galactocerebrosidase)